MRSLLSRTLAAGLIMAAPSFAQIPAFQVTALPELAGSTSTVGGLMSLDDDILMAGRSDDASGVSQALFYDGSITPPSSSVLPGLDSLRHSWANVIAHDAATSGRYVAGLSTNPMGLRKPSVWFGEGPLGPPGELQTLAGGEGEVLGLHWPSHHSLPGVLAVGWANTGAGLEKAVAWTGASAATAVIATLPHYSPASTGRAVGSIADLTYLGICGWAVDGSNNTVPQSWRSTDGGSSWIRTALPLLPGGNQGWANAMELGLLGNVAIVGASETAGGNQHAVRWRSTDAGQSWAVTDLGTLAGLLNSEASGMSLDAGSAFVGRSWTTPGAELATLWIEKNAVVIVHDLNVLAVGGSALVLRSATNATVSTSGELTIIGEGTTAGPLGRSAAPAGPHAWVMTQTGATSASVTAPAINALEMTVAPNPFRTRAAVAFDAPADGPVRIVVFDAAGRRVATLADGSRQAGRHTVGWDGFDRGGRRVAPGMYFVRLETGGRSRTDKLVRIR